MTTKPSFIKDTAKRLLKQYPDLWTLDFETNKNLVEKLTNIQSKRVRNEIAGYIIRLKKRKWKR